MIAAAEIRTLRRALGLTEEDEALVHEAGLRLVGEVDHWVEAFHARLTADPAALGLLRDEATTVRVKRSLAAWFQELFSLPYDAAYERARCEIGRVHLRAGLPQHLMVTAMSGVRRDVRSSVAQVWAGEPARASRVVDAVEKVFDLELALMLDAYRRRARELDLRTDRSLLVHRAEARAARERTDATDTATCYLSLLRHAREPESSERWAACLAHSFEAVVRPPGSARRDEHVLAEPARLVGLAEICAHALGQVSAPPRTEIEVSVVPADARVVSSMTALGRAIEELLQVSVNRDPGGSVRLVATALADGGLLVEASDGGPRWPEGAHTVEEGLTAMGAFPIAFGEHVAELHGGALELVHTPGHGGGLRLHLPPVIEEAVM